MRIADLAVEHAWTVLGKKYPGLVKPLPVPTWIADQLLVIADVLKRAS